MGRGPGTVKKVGRDRPVTEPRRTTPRKGRLKGEQKLRKLRTTIESRERHGDSDVTAG